MAMEPAWRQERADLAARMEELRRQGMCPTCHDLQTGALFGGQPVIYDDEQFRVVLDLYPRAVGHTIVVYKSHRDDLAALTADETGPLLWLCVRVMNALKTALGAEKVYLNTMCDGGINHLHLQLLPRYPGDAIGSRRFVADRRPLTDGARLADRIRAALAGQ